MGQKLNPIIFRLGINKTWKTEFYEKKNQELPLYIFKDLEIRNYIERVFETNGIIVHDYKQHYNASTLNLYISYFITTDFVSEKTKNSEQITIKNAKGTKITLDKNIHTLDFSHATLANNLSKNLTQQDSLRSYRLKRYLNLNFHSQLFTNAFFMELRKLKRNKYLTSFSTNFSEAQLEGVFCHVFAVLNSFLNDQQNIVINFCCINKNAQFLKLAQKKTFISFQKYRNTSFFKEGIELLFNVVYNTNSANLLAKFIALQLKKVKRHKFLLSFLKQTLSILLTSSLTKVKGIKIIVKGRLNGVPRAKHKIIIVGEVPVQTIMANLDYSQATAHNSNGSYGIKVWVVEKQYI